MAFWGVEVKPGKPFSHECDDSKGRLHISMATLGFGSATTKSTLQCNVGNRSPVYLCSLYPGSTESLQLNLELEEDEDVLFSVIGPRSIHLCGYYLGTSRKVNFDDESESYGEDIANTETDRSGNSDEDEYGGSFIDDDGDLKVFPESPISDKVGTFHDNKMKDRKTSLRRLRRKYQSVESDDNEDFEENAIVSGSMDDQTKEVDNEDNLPISSVFKSNARRRILDELMNDSGDEEEGSASTQNDEDNGNSIIETDLKTRNALIDGQTQSEAAFAGHLVDPCTSLDVEDTKTLKKKKKGKGKGEGKEIEGSFNMHSMELKSTVQDDPKVDKMTSDLLAGNEQKQEEHVDDNEAAFAGHLVDPCTVLDVEDTKTLKRKKKGKGMGEGKEIKGSFNMHSMELKSTVQDDPKMEKMTSDLLAGNEQNQEEHVDDNEAALACHLVDSCTVLDVEDTKTLRKKKKGKGNGKGKEIEGSFNMHSMELKNTVQADPKMEKMTSDLLAGNEQNQEHVDDKKSEAMVEILTSTEVGHGKGEKVKKKRKERCNDACDSNLVNLPRKNEDNEQPAVNEDVQIADNAVLPGAEKVSEKNRRKKRKKEHVTKGSDIEGDIGYHEDIAEEYKANKDKENSNNLIPNVSEGKQHQKLTNEKSLDCGAHDFADGNQNDGKIKKRKKSKSKGIEVSSELLIS